MSGIQVLTLGAGQDIGKSCSVVSIGGRRILFDCGMHMGYNDARRFPDVLQTLTVIAIQSPVMAQSGGRESQHHH